MRFLLMNQYGPGESAPTARLLNELGDYLRGHGHAVEFVFQNQGYRGRPATGASRMRRELAALLSMVWTGGLARKPKPDIVLTLSSPPGMLVAGAVVAWRHGAALMHWAMDLYPELAVALGEIKRGSVVAALVRLAMKWGYRRTLLTIALDEDMRSHLRAAYGIDARVLPPWPSRGVERAIASALLRAPDEPAAPWTWLYSGNLGRAHEWRTLLGAQHLLEAGGLPVDLVFQGDGAARASAQAHARELGLVRCAWRDYVPAEELVASLLASRVLIVTQRPETRGLLWPSKLSLLEQLPRTILWVGPTDSAIADNLKARGNTGVFAPGDAAGVAAWIEEAYQRRDLPQPLPAPQPAREAGCAALAAWSAEIAPGG